MHEQYFKLVTEDCTAEEKAMIVPVRMSDKDNYNSETPVLKSEKTLSTKSNQEKTR